MIKKRCLFCDEFVVTQKEGDYDKYIGCSCSPSGFYCLRSDSYEPINSLPHQKKRHILHLVSAYIREKTDCDEKINLSADDIESIVTSPQIPATIEDKGNRLLQYIYRHSEGLGYPVVIQPLSSNYNLTYSPNLQELVYILDKVISEGVLIREGITFTLTEKGWREAAASAGGKRLKPCFILLPHDEDISTEWLDRLLPKIEQCGYMPHLLPSTTTQNRGKQSLEFIRDCKLIIADLTGQSPEVYFTAGYGFGLNIPVIWTVNSRDAAKLSVWTKDIRPIVWDTVEELEVILQQRLVYSN